ncbi:unnamed protein product [Dovyalis caffra]|uniref:Uncharacterized protein n=1 Tax=Dovyalis caffra TaxID=77055 RepID=A0AAV1S7R1_9ROSI|nr:unnamed protein product [Dovyalis caffra]
MLSAAELVIPMGEAISRSVPTIIGLPPPFFKYRLVRAGPAHAYSGFKLRCRGGRQFHDLISGYNHPLPVGSRAARLAALLPNPIDPRGIIE